jgi:hypothetical protein
MRDRRGDDHPARFMDARTIAVTVAALNTNDARNATTIAP